MRCKQLQSNLIQGRSSVSSSIQHAELLRECFLVLRHKPVLSCWQQPHLVARHLAPAAGCYCCWVWAAAGQQQTRSSPGACMELGTDLAAAQDGRW